MILSGDQPKPAKKAASNPNPKQQPSKQSQQPPQQPQQPQQPPQQPNVAEKPIESENVEQARKRKAENDNNPKKKQRIKEIEPLDDSFAITIGDFSIKLADFSTLKQGFYVRENIIDAFLESICGDDIVWFPTSFFEQGVSKEKKVKSALAKKKNKPILIPLNYPKGVHYSLAIIQDSTIYHLNSWWNKSRSTVLFTELFDSFEGELGELLVEPYTKKAVPQQQYDCDCGVFLCWFVDLFVKKQLDLKNLPQQKPDVTVMRKRICDVILEKVKADEETKQYIKEICEEDEEEDEDQ